MAEESNVNAKWLIIGIIIGALLLAYVMASRAQVAEEKEWCRNNNVSSEQCTDAFGHL